MNQHVARVAIGVTAMGTSVGLIPVRTTEGVDQWVWIILYIIYSITISFYLVLQYFEISGPTADNEITNGAANDTKNDTEESTGSSMENRRKAYLFCTFILTAHFVVALSQSTQTVNDAITVYGPLMLALSTYLMAGMFRAGSVPLTSSVINGAPC
ncbi:hypothetical protein DL95DRAFT_465640 [Leptodontidium sp. 2 PMI_412]|nr:hypothetical protein DL95DRAFT_465640 [Leptodontidium sp. 2 PMI_412]